MDITQVPPWPVYGQQVAATLAQFVAEGAVYDYVGRAPVTELEQEFSNLHDRSHVVSFNSGTSALFAALCGLGVAAGDEILVPNLTFLASASPAFWLDAEPVLVDSAPDDPSISPNAILAAITPKTRVVIVTHLFGNPVDIETIATICARRGILLLEDCSHAHASEIAGRHVGTFGDAAIYSIGAGKLVSGGHGGILVTPHAKVRDLALLVGHFKPRTRTDVQTNALRPYGEFGLGGNLRLSPLAAVLALDHLRSITAISRARCSNVSVLDEHLEGLLVPVRAPAPRANLTHFDMVYMLPRDLPTSHRDTLLKELESLGVPARVPSTRPLNRVLRAMPPESNEVGSPMLRRLNRLVTSTADDDGFPHSTNLHDRMVSLPAGHLYREDVTTADALGASAARAIRRLLGKSS